MDPRHANGDVTPLQPTANGHASVVEDTADAAALEQLRTENVALREKLEGVDKRIAGAAAVQVLPEYSHDAVVGAVRLDFCMTSLPMTCQCPWPRPK